MFEERFEDFVGLIASIEKEIQRIKTAELARFGLRAGDLMCIYNLQKHPEGLTSAELARVAGIDRAAVSRVVSRLSADGFVEVGDDEGATSGRYRAPLRLTEMGHAVMVEVDDIIRNVVSEAGSGLSPSNREAMYSSLSSVLDHLKTISL